MSRRAIAGAAAILLAGTAVGAAAQAPDSVRRRADSLLAEWRLAQRVADLVDSVERERAAAQRDTVRVGALRVIVNPSPLPVPAAALRAWPAIDSLYGRVADQLAPVVLLAFDPDSTVPPPEVYAGLPVPWDLTVENVADLLVAQIAPPAFDRALGAWLGSPLRPVPGVDVGRRHAAVYVALAMAPSHAVSRCLRGERDACRAVLDLGGPADALDRWYPLPDERRALVTSQFAGYFGRHGQGSQFQACAAGNDSACTALLRALPEGTLPRVLDTRARDSFLRFALALGGAHGYARLVHDTLAAVPDRIAAAAGLPLDSLLDRWHTAIVAARPRAGFPLVELGIGIGWIAVFAAFSLRSSRWRGA